MGDSELPFECGVCGIIFDCSISYIRHKAQHLSDKLHLPSQGLYLSKLRKHCLKYSQPCWQVRELNRHKIPNNFLSCFICGKKFTKRRIFETHLAIHESKESTNGTFKCNLCKKDLLSSAALKIHQIRSHQNHLFTHDVCKENFIVEKTQQEQMRRKYCNEATLFKCSECVMVFKRRGTLKKHKCNKQEPKCLTCGKIFSCERAKRTHMLTHAGLRPHQCFDCGKSFSFKHALLIHKRVHTGEKPHVCKLCNRSYTMKTSLNRHMRSHQKDLVNLCPVCGKTLATPFLLKLHIRTHTGERPFSCHTCNKKFASKAYLKIHSRIHLNVRPYSCQKCAMKFRQISHLKTHMLTHSKSKFHKFHKCLRCNIEFKYKSNFNQHMKEYHSVGSRSHKCLRCEADFSFREDLQMHLQNSHVMSESEVTSILKSLPGDESCGDAVERRNNHRAQPAHRCSVCNKSFMQKGSLKKHLSIHERQYSCNLCKKSFEFESSLTSHMNIHSKRVHECNLCCSSFTTRSTLKAHMLTHTGEKPFPCSVCDKKFSTKSNLTVHMRIHTKEKPFQCPHCLQSFSQKSSLKYHLRRHPSGVVQSVFREIPNNCKTLELPYECKPLKTPYKCCDCKEEFDSLEALDTHMLSHRRDSTESCHVYNDTFLSEKDLLSHKASHSVEEIVCVVKAEESSQYMKEIIINANLKSEVLDLQDDAFMDPELERITDDVNASMMLDSDNNDDELTTDVLEEITTNSDEGIDFDRVKQEVSSSPAERIFLVENDSKEEDFDSHLCEVSLYQSDPLRTCIAMHRITASYKCTLCGEGFEKKSSLNDHILTHTNIHEYEMGDLMKVECVDFKGMSSQSDYSEVDHLTILAEDFSGNSELVNDNNNHHLSASVKVEVSGENDKAYKCSICGKGFSTKVDLKNHLLLHGGVKAFQYEVCFKRYALASYLKEHIHTKEKPFACEVCGKKFSQKSSLSNHIKGHSNTKPFICTWCGKAFINEGSLNKHIRIHTMKNVYDCTVCGKTFSQSRSLELHRKVHEMCTNATEDEALIIVNADPFKCTICGDNFSENQELEEHLVQHSLERSQKEKNIKTELKCEKEIITVDKVHSQKTPVKNKTKHTCPECAKSFRISALLKSHMRIHTGEKPFQCEVCGRKFGNRKNLKTHCLVHTGIKPYQCHICGKRFKQLVHRRNHLRIHSEVKPYTCILCGKGYTVSNSLKLHMKTHTGDKPFECVICGKRFTQKGLLKSHMISHTGDKPLSCLKCDKRFSHASEVLKHLMMIHMDLKLYSCTLCEEDFSQKNSLIEHLRKHKKEESPECMICGKVLVPKELESHVLANIGDGNCSAQSQSLKPKTDDRAESYKCCVCEQVFHWKTELKAHLLSHIGVKPYECSLCGLAFSDENLLESHKVSHENDGKQTEKEYFCTICAKQYKRKGSYESHMANHSISKFFECPTCGKTFKTKGILKGHMLIHKGERPHNCPTCGKDFRTTSALNVHLKIHSSDRPHQCNVCNKSFKMKSILQNHMNVHSKKAKKKDTPTQVKLEKRGSFGCRLCDKTFNTKDELVTHMPSHEREKPYTCIHCPKGFSVKAALDKHMLAHLDDDGNRVKDSQIEKATKNNVRIRGRRRKR